MGLSVFFALLMFLLNCEPEFASSRFDSGVSILAAAFVRPDGWIQGPLVTPEAQSSSTRWQNQVLYRPVVYHGEHYCARGAARIVIWSCNGREAMSPIWMEVARVAGSLGYIGNWPFYKAVCCVDG